MRILKTAGEREQEEMEAFLREMLGGAADLSADDILGPMFDVQAEPTVSDPDEGPTLDVSPHFTDFQPIDCVQGGFFTSQPHQWPVHGDCVPAVHQLHWPVAVVPGPQRCTDLPAPPQQQPIHGWPLAGVQPCGHHASACSQAAAAAAAAYPANTFTSRKRKAEESNQPYVKKPPNAFMIFLNENRRQVMADLKLPDSATTNKVLGHMWSKVMTKEEKEYFFQRADIARRQHAEKYPGWSSLNNYGKKRRRARGKAATFVTEPEPKTVQLNQMYTTLVTIDAMEAGLKTVMNSTSNHTGPLLQSPQAETWWEDLRLFPLTKD